MKTVGIIAIISIFVAWSVYAVEVGPEYLRPPVEAELEEKEIVKRQATSPPPQHKAAPSTYTSVRTKGGCKLYALNVTFFKKTARSGEAAKFDIVEVPVAGTDLKSANEGSCTNYSGSIILDYSGTFKPSTGDKGLTSLKLTFNVSHLKTYGWWELSTLDVEANGPLTDNKPFSQKFEGNVMRTVAIGGAKRFSYACGQPPTLYYSADEKYTTVYGIKFRNLQIQPFEWGRSPGNFTNEVDDCVPFFSIGIWMFLVVAAVLLLVIFFGIGMISSLKTMDRFDDPKGKPLVINTKE